MGTDTPESLDMLFAPASVAIVGASNDPDKVGGRPLHFLKLAGYSGRIVPVNHRESMVQGLPAWRSLDEAVAQSGPVDQAIIAVPAGEVLAVARRCLALGAKALQIFSAGFGEGDTNRAAREALVAEARDTGARVLGPNSLGVFDLASRFFGTFATALDGCWPRHGVVSVATQSGAFGSYFFGMAQARGVGFRRFVATGNESDVQVADCISYFARDPDSKVIVMAMEGCRDGRRLVRALAEARAAGKLVLAMKVGSSDAGARAAATHTGALTGADRVFDAVLRDAGVHRAASLQALVDAACVASQQPRPPSRDLLVVTTSGGIGVLSADAAEAHGLALPPIDDSAALDIKGIAPLADGRNPVDTSAGILGRLGSYAEITERAMQSRPYGMVLCFLAHIARNPAHWAQLRIPLYAWRARNPQVTVAAVLLAEQAVQADLQDHGFTVFDDPTRAVSALAACSPRLELQTTGSTPSSMDERLSTVPSQAAPTVAIDACLKPSDLADAGIAFAPERLVATAHDAARAGAELGYPVVLKIASPDIAHKTEVGGVHLGLASESELRAAVPAMLKRVKAARPEARIDGFIVARQLSGGVELLVGTQCDPVFGPVVTLGAGGILAELLDDVRLGLAPIDAGTAKALLLQTRVGRLLQGYRGGPTLDVDSAARQIALLSEIAWLHRDRVDGIDLNPLLVTTHGAFALDALVAMRPPGHEQARS